ncbi:hypothetical protein [Mycolicibacter minnesotensis]
MKLDSPGKRVGTSGTGAPHPHDEHSPVLAPDCRVNPMPRANDGR